MEGEQPQQRQRRAARRGRGVERREVEQRNPELMGGLTLDRRDHVGWAEIDLDDLALRLLDPGFHGGHVAEALREEEATGGGDHELVVALEPDVGRALSEKNQLSDLGAVLPVLLDVEANYAESPAEVRHHLDQQAPSGLSPISVILPCRLSCGLSASTFMPDASSRRYRASSR